MIMNNINQELHQNFLDFSYEANSQRAFADARDGLKPGQRACLWEMYDKKYTSNKKYIKTKDMRVYYSYIDKIDANNELKEIYYVGKSNISIDISKYKKAQPVKENDGDEELVGKEMVRKLIKEYGKELEDKIEKNSILKIDDKKDLYIYSIDVYYYIDDSEEAEESKKDKKNNKVNGNVVIDSYDMDAIILEK